MKLSVLAAVAALVCGGSASGCKKPASATKPSGPPAAAARYQATRWVPARPSYVLAAPTVREAQGIARELIEGLGMAVGVEVGDVSRGLTSMLAVDLLSPEAVSAIGVDVEGGFVMFAEDVSPTFVVPLAAPDQLTAFFDRQRERGLVTQSVMVEGTELFTAKIDSDLSVSWAVADGWVWVHFVLDGMRDEGTAWFTHSYRPGAAAWADAWTWAEGVGKLVEPGVSGIIDAQQLVGKLVARVPDAMTCAKLLAPVQRVGVAFDVEGKTGRGRLTLDLGAAAAGMARTLLASPEGFEAVAAQAPLAVQWNADLFALRDHLAPCLRTIGVELPQLDELGVRAGRAALLELDADDKKGAGVVALDLAHKKFFAAQLDQIPMRSALERSRTFGPHKGRALAIPFVASVDYVLTDALGLVGMGDGLLARMVGSGKTVPAPVAALDVRPGALSAESWATLLEAVDIRRSERVIERMRAWREGRFRIELEGSALAITATGTRL